MRSTSQGETRALERGGDGHLLAVSVSHQHSRDAACRELMRVSREHLRGGAFDDRMAPGESRRGVGDRDHVRHRADGAEKQPARQHDQDDEEDAGRPPVVAAALACESGHAKGARRLLVGGYRPNL